MTKIKFKNRGLLELPDGDSPDAGRGLRPFEYLGEMDDNGEFIFDERIELREFMREYGFKRVVAVSRLFSPYSSIGFLEDVLDDWKEESLQMSENPDKCINKLYPRKITYDVFNKLGCFWSDKYKESTS